MSKRSAKKTNRLWLEIRKLLPGFILGLLTAVITLVFGSLTNLIMVRFTEASAKKNAAAIEQLIKNEADLATKYSGQDRAKATEESYMQLFTPDAWIMDVHDRKSAVAGREEIRKRLCGLPSLSVDHELTVTPQVLTDTTAIAQTRSVVRMSKEQQVGYERWFFRKIDNEWKIQRFEYNLDPTDR